MKYFQSVRTLRAWQEEEEALDKRFLSLLSRGSELALALKQQPGVIRHCANIGGAQPLVVLVFRGAIPCPC